MTRKIWRVEVNLSSPVAANMDNFLNQHKAILLPLITLPSDFLHALQESFPKYNCLVTVHKVPVSGRFGLTCLRFPPWKTLFCEQASH